MLLLARIAFAEACRNAPTMGESLSFVIFEGIGWLDGKYTLGVYAPPRSQSNQTKEKGPFVWRYRVVLLAGEERASLLEGGGNDRGLIGLL